jgi:peptide/nickel transport system substrate-binding protein
MREPPEREALSDRPRRTAHSRRAFLKGAVGGVAALGAGGSIAACSTSSSPTVHSATSKRGGTLRLGMTGASTSDEINPLVQATNPSTAMDLQVFDSLVIMDREAVPQLSLAEEVTPNSNATEWTIRVRPDVTFHNGKDLTADDVIYTFQLIQNPKAPGVGATGIAPVDSANIKKLDRLTVRVPCNTPFSTFFETMATNDYFIVPEGFDYHKPVGTGPFRYESFTPAVRASFLRNDDYWGGSPYLDAMEWTFFADETSQVNALLSDQVDAVSLLSADSISAVRSGGGVLLIGEGGGWTPIVMNCSTPPFTDVRVRQAFKYIVDRGQMLDELFLGHGIIGNDIFSIWDPVYDHSLPQRPHDPDKAKSLLKQAGHDGLHVTLVTSPIAQATVQMAEVFAQQAKAANVSVTLQQETVTTFFGPNYLKWGFTQDFWYYAPYFWQVASAMLPSSPFPETHFTDDRYVALYAEALRTVDSSKRKDIAHEMQTIEWDSDGYIIPYFPPVIDAHSVKLHGAVTSKLSESFNDFNFTRFWFS